MIIKKILLSLLTFWVICSCKTEPIIVSSYSLNKADGIYKHKEKPFNGVVIDTTKSGRVLLTFNCIDGKLDGEYLKYFRENGNLKERVTYVNGNKNGSYKKLNKDGKVVLEGNYVNFKRNGEWKEYYYNGGIKNVGSYMDGLQVGEWNFYFINGKLQAIGNYDNGDKTDLGKTGIPISGRNGIWKFYNEFYIKTFFTFFFITSDNCSCRYNI